MSDSEEINIKFIDIILKKWRFNLAFGTKKILATVGRSDTNRIFDFTCETSLLNFIVDITYCQVPNFSDKAPIGFITSGFMKLSVILECGKIEIITA